MIKVLISVLGQDQQGIIATMSRVISDHQGNIENVSQTLLQDIFGALLLVSIPDESGIGPLRDALREGCRPLNLVVNADPYISSQPQTPPPEVQPYVVTANGPDRNGLVASISASLSSHGLNITNLHARFSGGSKRFDNVMIFEVDVPRETVMDDLRAELQAIANRLGLEINIQHRRIFEAVSHIDR